MRRFLKFIKSKRAVGSIETGVKVITAVVCGAAILVGLFALVNEVVLPTATNKISSMFAYKAEGGSGTGTGSGTGGGSEAEIPVPDNFTGVMNGKYFVDSNPTKLTNLDGSTWTLKDTVDVNSFKSAIGNYYEGSAKKSGGDEGNWLFAVPADGGNVLIVAKCNGSMSITKLYEYVESGNAFGYSKEFTATSGNGWYSFDVSEDIPPVCSNMKKEESFSITFYNGNPGAPGEGNSGPTYTPFIDWMYANATLTDYVSPSV